MEKIKNLSLRKTIILYMVISLVISFFSSAIITKTAEDIQEKIWWKYTDKESYLKALNGPNGEYVSYILRKNVPEMKPIERQIVEICDFLSTWSVLIISVAGSCIAVFLFYNNKLKKPINELERASKFISQDVLDFKVTYENKDELGRLCKEFEKMRLQLFENNRTMWHMIEDEKALRAAIAHDIRSPLSVLKGYQEMLLEFVPENTLDKNKIIEMLEEGMKQIERINRFIETMRKMNSLSDRSLQFGEIYLNALGEQIQKDINIINKNSNKSCTVKVNDTTQAFYADKEIILEVVENLVSNALRYAKNQIEITISSKEHTIIIEVTDDGIGFHESPEIITKAFYHHNPIDIGQTDYNSVDYLGHFGIGMYISRIYCEKHGGKLIVGNGKNKGAKVQAYFKSNI